jgi:CP family cyanate transporter-like MFS transporter
VTNRARPWIVIALALTGLSMRTAVTSVGAALGAIEAGLHTNSGVAGLITTLPPLCFAVLGALAPGWSRRIGPHRLLVVALITMSLGLAARALVGSIWLFLLLSVLGLAGGAVANVLMPSLVKAHFPDRIGPMTALYTTMMAIGTTLGAGLTVPIGSLAGGWRLGIGSWALLSAIAVIPWLPTLRGAESAAAQQGVRMPVRALIHSRIAWYVALFFAFQSLQAYVAFGWFERFLTAHSISAGTAGWMVALLSAVQIPASIIAPTVPIRFHRPLLLVLAASYAIAYAGLLTKPGWSWAWMVLAGLGGGMFPFSLTLIGYRSARPATTATLSAFAQSFGYVIAACGPFLFGTLHQATGGWAAPFAVLWVALAVALVSGWFACRRQTVDEELAI